MNEEIYQVERNDYVGFIGQINPKMTDVEEEILEDRHIIKIKSQKTGNILCARIIMEDQQEYYYVYNMPLDEERIPPKKIRQIKLETKEEVQHFFDALSKIMKENQND